MYIYSRCIFIPASEKHKIISNLANKLCAPNETKQNEVRRDNCPARCLITACRVCSHNHRVGGR